MPNPDLVDPNCLWQNPNRKTQKAECFFLLTPWEGRRGGLSSLKRYLKKVSRLRPAPLRWKCLKLSMMACASSSVAFSCLCTSTRNLLRCEGVMSSFSEYSLNRVLISDGASASASLNRRRQQKHTLYVCFDVITCCLHCVLCYAFSFFHFKHTRICVLCACGFRVVLL